MCGRRGDLGSGGHRAGGDIFVTVGHCVAQMYQMFSILQTYPIASYERKKEAVRSRVTVHVQYKFDMFH